MDLRSPRVRIHESRARRVPALVQRGVLHERRRERERVLLVQFGQNALTRRTQQALEGQLGPREPRVHI